MSNLMDMFRILIIELFVLVLMDILKKKYPEVVFICIKFGHICVQIFEWQNFANFSGKNTRESVIRNLLLWASKQQDQAYHLFRSWKQRRTKILCKLDTFKVYHFRACCQDKDCWCFKCVHLFYDLSKSFRYYHDLFYINPIIIKILTFFFICQCRIGTKPIPLKKFDNAIFLS